MFLYEKAYFQVGWAFMLEKIFSFLFANSNYIKWFD
nr:MAG TPA: hypothetical protein [Caudoviricetes sp.]